MNFLWQSSGCVWFHRRSRLSWVLWQRRPSWRRRFWTQSRASNATLSRAPCTPSLDSSSHPKPWSRPRSVYPQLLADMLPQALCANKEILCRLGARRLALLTILVSVPMLTILARKYENDGWGLCKCFMLKKIFSQHESQRFFEPTENELHNQISLLSRRAHTWLEPTQKYQNYVGMKVAHAVWLKLTTKTWFPNSSTAGYTEYVMVAAKPRHWS